MIIYSNRIPDLAGEGDPCILTLTSVESPKAIALIINGSHTLYNWSSKPQPGEISLTHVATSNDLY